jgi:post-segregation antitoxin (ccd killing protein)
LTEPDSDTKSGLQWQRAKLRNEHQWSDRWGVENRSASATPSLHYAHQNGCPDKKDLSTFELY